MPRSKPKPGKPRRGFFRRLVRLIVLCCLLAVFLSWMAVLPLRWIDPPTTAFMLLDASERETLLYAWVPWSDVGTSMPIAVDFALELASADAAPEIPTATDPEPLTAFDMAVTAPSLTIVSSPLALV